MAEELIDRSRRRVVCAALGGLALQIAPGLPARAREKMTKERAEYQDTPKDIWMCATCTLFEPPKSCQVVEGDVSPEGWCNAFALAD